MLVSPTKVSHMVTQEKVSLGMRVRLARTLRRLRQDQLANKAGTTATDVSRLECDRPVAADRQARILAVLGLDALAAPTGTRAVAS